MNVNERAAALTRVVGAAAEYQGYFTGCLHPIFSAFIKPSTSALYAKAPKNELGALGKWVSMIFYLGETGRIVKPSQRMLAATAVGAYVEGRS